jgi:hypothetical protein
VINVRGKEGGVWVGWLSGGGRRFRGLGWGSKFFVDRGGACLEEVGELGFRVFDGQVSRGFGSWQNGMGGWQERLGG